MKIKFFHRRNHTLDGNTTVKGGTTTAYVVDENNLVIGYAQAQCHEKDNFCKHTGRVKAEGRLKSPRYYNDTMERMEEKEFFRGLV